jgi:hypothetical protein
MIAMVQPLHIGNALRLFFEPPAGAVRWKVLRKGLDSFSGHDDVTAAVVYEGDERVTVDSAFLTNDVMAFYRPFYTTDGVTWSAGPTAYGTPAAVYKETTTDVISFLRERLEAGLLIELQRGSLVHELGYVPVYTATPSLEQGLTFPLVTVHLENEEDAVRGIGDDITGDIYDATDGTYEESEGWLSSARVTLIGWSLNGDERVELRKAIRRIVIANLPVFSQRGWEQVSLTAQDVDAVNGEYPAPLFQVMCNFTCIAPVRVGSEIGSIREITSRSLVP